MFEFELAEDQLTLFRQLSGYTKPFFPSHAHSVYGKGEDYWEWFFRVVSLMRIGLFNITEETKPAGVPATFELTAEGREYLSYIERNG